MIRLQVALVDAHAGYLAKLTAALKREHSNQLEVFAFSSLDKAYDFLDEVSVDVLLVDEDLATEGQTGKRGAELVYFTPTKEVEAIFGRPAICKYQSVDLIFKSIIDVCSEKFDHKAAKTTVAIDSQVIAFFPASGGSGASTLAASCALAAVKRGMRVCYLNLELYGTASRFFTGPGTGGLDDALLAIKTKKSNLILRLQSIIKECVPGLCFIESCASSLDIADIRSDEFEQLVQGVSQAGMFDLIVLDMDFAWSHLSMTALSLADQTVFVSNGTPVSNAKFERVYGSLRALELRGHSIPVNKIAIMYNNFSSKTGRRLEASFVPTLGGAPRFVCDTTGELIDSLSSHQCFNRLFVKDQDHD